MTRIEHKFRELKKSGRKAFIAFITAGYPDLRITEGLIREFDAIGVDIVELGVPFTDPMADGPVIQEASQAALKNKTHLIDILNLVKKVRRDVRLPICLMTYYNPIFCLGEARFVAKAGECGVDGVIIPDLPPEEGAGLIRRARKTGLDVISFLSPTSSPERIKHIANRAHGFIYYVSLTGVTGARKDLSRDLKESIKGVKRYARAPVCVGFGVSTPAQVKQVRAFADGVIVGSAIVKKIKENIGKPNLIKKVSSFVQGLRKVF
ncbi:MAG: tryptophan synthase subunit alpha [Candidatus Omnitrophica bacterium]|nr:tryptophan synthase subunit alpha [Candidatus Omnitrophota bacterium]